MKGRYAILLILLVTPILLVIWLLALETEKQNQGLTLSPDLHIQPISPYQIWILVILGGLFIGTALLAIEVEWWRKNTHRYQNHNAELYRRRHHRF